MNGPAGMLSRHGETAAGGTDQVAVAYNLDGTAATRTAQKHAKNLGTLPLYSITPCGTRTYKAWRGSENASASWVAPAYDACGNAVTMPRPGLPGRRRGKPGDPTASFACKYDAWNRLVEVRAGENLVAKYEYDGLGRRVKAHIDTTDPYDGTIDVYRHFYYNAAWQLLETRTSTSENTEPEGVQPECQYVWSARYIDSPVLRDKNTDTDGLCNDERLYYTTDANQNVTALVDTSGAAVERYVYDPYGKVTIYDGSWSNPPRTTSSYANAILYCGYYRDGETGLYHVRNRVYNTAIGGWVQRDPLGYADGVSLYEYCGGAPASATDAMGLRPMGAGDAGYQSGYENLPWKNVDDSPAPKTAKKKPPKGQVVYIGPQGVGGRGEVPGGGGGGGGVVSGTTGPPSVPVPGGGPDNGWKWNPDPNNSRGGSWGPKTPIPGQSQPNASWEPDGPVPHWDVNDGKGKRQRYDADDKPITPEEAHGRTPRVEPPTVEDAAKAVAVVGAIKAAWEVIKAAGTAIGGAIEGAANAIPMIYLAPPPPGACPEFYNAPVYTPS